MQDEALATRTGGYINCKLDDGCLLEVFRLKTMLLCEIDGIMRIPCKNAIRVSLALVEIGEKLGIWMRGV